MTSAGGNVFSYGESKDQFIRVTAPHAVHGQSSTALPIIFIVHGGYWKQQYGIDSSLANYMAPFWSAVNYWVCEVEYRRGRADQDGGEGGFPNTNLDFLSAMNKMYSLANEHEEYKNKIDMNRAVVLGHSAGGTQVLWGCATHPQDSPAHSVPLLFTPALCVAVTPVGDLVYGAERRLSDNGDAIQIYLNADPEYQQGQSGEVKPTSVYRFASPHLLLPLKCPCLIIGGGNDDAVPVDVVQNFHHKCVDFYAAHAVSTPAPELLVIEESDHFMPMNCSTKVWSEVYAKIRNMLG